MSNGLLVVFSEPGRVPLEEFHDWYDHEHIPLRLQYPEFQNAYRFEAMDELTPAWMAAYDVDPAFLDTERYKSLRTNRSRHERDIVENLDTLDRRVYVLEQEAGKMKGQPQYQVVVGLTSRNQDALLDWYRSEHIPLLLQIPGWNRIRQYRLLEGAGERILTIHDIQHPAVCDSPLWRYATSTPWRERTMSEVTSRSRRLFRLHNAGDRPPPGWSNPYI